MRNAEWRMRNKEEGFYSEIRNLKSALKGILEPYYTIWLMNQNY